MGSEWTDTLLEELADEVTVGFVGSMTSEYVEDGIPFFRSKNVNPYKLNWDDVKYVSREFHEKIKKSSLWPGDVVIVRTGKPGTACMIPDEVAEANCSDLVIVRPGPNLDKRFLVYFLNSAAAHHINANLVGAVQQHFNVGAAKKLSIPLPPLPEQKAIAHILGTLDDKIELNRRMNATLEGMAQALFKSWFIDFDPVLDNAILAGNPIPDEFAERAKVRRAILEKNQPSPNLSQGERNYDSPESSSPSGRSGDEGPQANALAAGNPIPDELADRACLRASHRQAEIRKNALASNESSLSAEASAKAGFPAAFQFTEEMGWIPEGWEVKQVKHFGSVVCGKTPSKSNADYYGNDVPFIKIPDMHRSAWITETTDGLSFAGANSQAKKQIPAKSISVSCIATVGKVVVTSEPSHTNQQINSVIPNAEYLRNYLYFSFLEKNKELHDLASGGSATLNLNTGVFSKIRLLSPPATALELYHEATNPLFEKMLANDRESQSLTKLRDTLLPKLISGDLRIPNNEKQRSA